MDSAKVLHWWHLAGIVATATGVIAAEAGPLVGANPKGAAVVGILGAISTSVTTVMNKLANDKVIAAIINDPDSPTPQGFGIPKPSAEVK